MDRLDPLTAKVKREWEENVARGERNTRPFLDLDVEALVAYREGRQDHLPGKPAHFSESPEGILYRNAAGTDTLCLASGGGQQSVELALMGAKVTVFDLAEGQLAMDRKAAEHYGYEVRTVQGDMRDLSVFPDASFDSVLQGISMTFVPDVRAAYREVHRVLRPGGFYAVAHCNPAAYPVCFEGPNNGWDGAAYRISEPYCGGPIRMTDAGVENMSEGAPTGEHRHLYRDIFNGLIELGFEIAKVWDPTWDDLYETMPEPGIVEHERAFEAYFSVLATKGA